MRTIKEIRNDIVVCNQNIQRFNEMAEEGKLQSEDYEDLDQFIGWRDALSWVLSVSKKVSP